MEHLLLRRAHRFPAEFEPQPDGWRYSRRLSVWVPEQSETGGGETARPRPTSKKQDVETGEDMKGA